MSAAEFVDSLDDDAETYDERFETSAGGRDDSVHQSIVQRFLDTLPAEANTFEIGCGTGRFTAKTTANGFKVTATDISREMLEQTHNRVSNDSLVESIQADATALPYQSDSFDAGIMINVLSHLPEPKASFEEIGRILNDDGLFLFNYPRLLSLYFPIGAYVNARDRSIHGDVYTHWYTRTEVDNLLSAAGLTVTDRFGHVHMPQRDFPVVTHLLNFLDKSSRQSAIRRIAPVEFVVAKRLNK
jgi:ubiquinone/menaquinone biosynthesis C-methylase UbiE